MKLKFSEDSEIRCGLFSTTNKLGTIISYPQITFLKKITPKKSIDVSFPLKEIDNIVKILEEIKNLNSNIFEAEK